MENSAVEGAFEKKFEANHQRLSFKSIVEES